jgi:trehalose/maltose hydrolase-like predicted phosphorylase
MDDPSVPVEHPGRPADGDLLDRTFAAVVFDWDGTAVPDRRTSAASVRRRVETLSRFGTNVAVVSGTHVGNIDGQLHARPPGPGQLLLALNRGSEVYQVRADGPHLLERRQATDAEERALDRAAQLLVTMLAARGLVAQVVSSRLNRRKIDLIPVAQWSDPPKARIAPLLEAVTTRLCSRGITGLGEVVDWALRAAADAGLPDPRVTSDVKHVEIGLTDKSDSMRSILAGLAGSGVGPGLVLIAGDEFGSLGGVPGSDSLLLVPEATRATVVSVGVEPSGVPPAVRHLGGGPPMFRRLLDEQVRRRRQRRVPTIDDDPAWVIRTSGVDPARCRVQEALLTVGDGGFATRGSVEEGDPRSTPLVAAAGVYDGAGPAQHLLPGPLWTAVQIGPPPGDSIRRLDLRTGVLVREELGAAGKPLRTFRFASAAIPGVGALRAEAAPGRVLARPVFRPPLDGPFSGGQVGHRQWARASGQPGGIGAVGRQRITTGPAVRTLERLVGYVADGSRQPRLARAHDLLAEAQTIGFDGLLARQRELWAARWADANITIPDDPASELAIRFALFQLWVNTGRRDELAVGARGLSGPGYGGHVFWDADVFVLPALASMDPRRAGAMVAYRLNRLGAARALARANGRAGARFPWESAATGDDVTPTAGVLGGTRVPVLTGPREEHITADVAWAAVYFATWTATPVPVALVTDTADYWASRCRLDGDGRAHIEGVIGPDEYHELVDDNAFTNVMARWNLRAAAELTADPRAARGWRELADALVDGYDTTTGCYEQFAGYHQLEPLLATDLPRRPVAADILLGRDRVAKSQLIKQPDVLMLHHLVPDLVAPGSLRPNLDHYNPRTTHGSSLSPAITASLLARAGRADDALEMLRIALALDLDDETGMTSAGLHMATLGGVWQAVLHGFLGASAQGGALQLDPRLPSSWPTVEAGFLFRGRRLRVRVRPDAIDVATDTPLDVRLPGRPPCTVAGQTRLLREA